MSATAAAEDIAASTVAAAIASARDLLAAAGVDQPARDARLLLAAATGWPMETLIAWPDRALSPEAAGTFQGLVARRAEREPVSRILGRRGFWRHEFRLGPGALDPRPDSEVIVDQALRRLPADAEGLVVDLGVGSGCLLLSVLAERPRMTGIGVDLGAEALRVAAGNAAALGLGPRCRLVRGDWAQALGSGIAACVLANPPYVISTAIDVLEPEVRGFDPRPALDGGVDGLVAYRSLGPQVRRILRPGGFAAIEIGADQGPAVSAILGAAGLLPSLPLTDLGGRDRCIIATSAA